jgi:rod shape determining protein RodA
MQTSARLWRHFDVWLLGVVVILSIAGVAMIRSAIAGNEELLTYPTRQAIFGAAGLLVAMILAAIDYRFWRALSRLMLLIVLVLLGSILIAGVAGFGSQRWFAVGVLTLQPSELAKILMILVLADYFARHQNTIREWRTIAGSILLIGAPFLLVFLQPDLSTSIVLIVIWLAMVFAIGIPLKYLAVLGVIGVLSPLLLWPFLAQYQQGRIITFLFPNPEASFGDTYNVNQARISIGSGGLFGKGYENGTQVQLRFLKVRHTDFIFSSMSEEFGFIGALIFLLLFIFVVIRCLQAARKARDLYGALICYGVAILLFFQGAFNIGMNLNLFPVSGLPLPFLSYGGSSLLTSLMGIGLVESVILRHKRIEL